MLTITDTFHSERLYDMETEINKKYGSQKAAYFDIETTGFSSKTQQIYLIGAAYKNDDGTFTVMQWFDDTSNDEAKMLLMFREFLKNFDVLINFNGNTFDIPFVLNRAMKYNIHFDFDRLILIDIYKEIKKYKKFFKTPDLKQKSIESFLGTYRDDEYNGGQLIEVYNEYITLKSNDDIKSGLRSVLLLHNHDDIIGLVNICDIIAYIEIFNGSFYAEKIVFKSNYLLISCLLKFKLKSPVFEMFDAVHHSIRYEAHDNSLKLVIPVTERELKYFYDNYKDYYYLPDEDTAIHKSVSQFVDKAYRKKATRDNCYIKKSGIFAPQPTDIFKPAFKVSYNDKCTYFEISDEFINTLNSECPNSSECDAQTEIPDSSLNRYVRELLLNMYF